MGKWWLLLALTAGSVMGQDQTWTVRIGQYPWHDRIGKWALSACPDKYQSDTPVPRQNCEARTIVLPQDGLKQVVIAVYEKDLAKCLEQAKGLTDTGDRLEIKQGGQVLSYPILTWDNPPKETTFRGVTAGVILVSLGGAAAPAATAKPAPPAVVPAKPADNSYEPKNGAAPWFDRVGKWAIVGLPEALAGCPAVPQQSCTDRTLRIPAGTTAATIAVVEADWPGFHQRYPTIQDTGLTLGIGAPGKPAALTYKILIWPSPPAESDCKAFTTGGVILLRLDGVTPPAPATGQAGLLAAEQEFAGQPLAGQAERQVKMFVCEPAVGITANTGLMLVLHNWGGSYNSPEYLKWCRTFADRYNVVAMSVNYLHSGADWKQSLPYDHGYLQAMDAIRALYTVWKRLKDQGVAFNEHRIYSMGGSGGGNVTQMAMKLAPHTFAAGVDICGMPGLIDAIAYGTGEGTGLNAGYSKDPAAANYLSPDMQEIRDFGHLDHCRLLKAANPGLKIVIVHGLDDKSCPVVPKIGQYQNMIRAGLEVDGHFLTANDLDGVAVTTTGHAVGNREQVVIKYADEYLKEAGKLAKATAGPSDFSRGGTFAYPTSNGKFVIDYSGVPTIRYEGK